MKFKKIAHVVEATPWFKKVLTCIARSLDSDDAVIYVSYGAT
jgi:hypothetical protein